MIFFRRKGILKGGIALFLLLLWGLTGMLRAPSAHAAAASLHSPVIPAVTGRGISAIPSSSASSSSCSPPICYPPAVSGQSINVTEGKQFDEVVATGFDQSITPNLTATIDWGDGSQSSGLVNDTGNSNFEVLGSHTYYAMRSFPTTIIVTDVTNNVSGTAGGNVQVGAAPITVSGTNITATAGVSFTGPIANVTPALQDPLAVSIDWGDNTTSSGTMSGGSASGTHTYSTPGTYTLKTTVTDEVSGLTGTGSSSATVVGVTVTGVNVSATADVPFSGQVANVADPSATQASQLTATIDWGDGSTSAGTISGANGTFQVNGDHTYTATGSPTITVSATDSALALTSAGTATATVASPLVSVSAHNINALAAVAFSGQVATVSDAAAAQSSQLSATIDWGDGITTTGTVNGTNGSFTVSGSHTYASAGSLTVKVSVTDTTTTQTASGNGTVTVAPLPNLSVTGVNVSATAETQFSGQVASITGAVQTSGLHVTIDWGDGTGSTSGKLSDGGNGILLVKGSHIYSSPGSYTITISVKDSVTGRKAQATATATVAPAPVVSVSVQNVSGPEGSFTGVVATGSETGITGTLSALITWGDGHVSSGSITLNADGTFSVNGKHAYEEGSYTVQVTVKDGHGHGSGSTGSAAISDAALIMSKFVLSVVQKTVTVKAFFTDADPQGATSDYQASIRWGDGTSSVIPVVKNPNGRGFLVSDTHQYAQHGSYTITLTITEVGGSSTSASNTASV